VKLCLVTDRRRLSPGETSLAATRRCLLEQARHAVEARVDLIQLRERDLSGADLAALVVDLLAIAGGSETRVVINDRLDVAIACGADGVHLRADSISVAAARQLAPPPFLIGRSVHDASEAAAAAAADYLIAGTVFPSVSKAGSEGGLAAGSESPASHRGRRANTGRTPPDVQYGLLGTEGLKAIVRAVSVPVVAIGGLNIERAGEVAKAGASGIAAIGLFIGTGRQGTGPQPEPRCLAVPLRDIADAVRRKFDSGRPAP
jgi:thiamine-phosphate pyrophosphorylase